MENRTIDSVVQAPTPEGWNWAVRSRDEQGEIHTHVFPPDIFEWRAAEYDLDPEADFELILDMVLHEPYIPNPQDPKNFDDDPANQRGLKSMASRAHSFLVSLGDSVPTDLYNAESVGKALEAHLVRVEHAKANRINLTAPQASPGRDEVKPPDPLDRIRNYPDHFDPEFLRKKRDMVSMVRAQLLDQAEQAPLSFAMSRRSMDSAPMMRRPMQQLPTQRPESRE